MRRTHLGRRRSPGAPAVVWVIAAAGLAFAWSALAQPAPGTKARTFGVVEDGPDRARIDWTRGLIVAPGAAPGDIRAPSPATARVAAERRARAQARERLAGAARALIVDGRELAAWAAEDAEVAERLAEALERTLDVSIDYGSDGSVMLSAGLPLEAVRLAVHGPPVRPVPAAKDDAPRPRGKAPTAIIVDARAVLDTPALGLTLAAGERDYTGPTVFYRRPARARADARAGPRPVRVRATAHDAGRLRVALGPARLERAKAAHALVIVILGRP